MLTREQATELLHSHMPQENLRAHSLAVAVVMQKLALRLEQDADLWYLTGLLHDIDYAYTVDDPSRHALHAMELLAGADLPEEALHAIRAHNDHESRESLLDRALWAVDPLTGLITASALMRPDHSVSAIVLKSIRKKFKSKAFAAGANREQIASCEDLGVPLADFLMLSIEAMGEVERELGLGEAHGE
ncbi:MAG: HDIG domain-containing protein [Candidatus Cloacimonetes bacterium]|nr:HDIG domain-containing protein [Candidatus Cloacimonadota bacterium]